jgi:hypothetical protein
MVRRGGVVECWKRKVEELLSLEGSQRRLRDGPEREKQGRRLGL